MSDKTKKALVALGVVVVGVAAIAIAIKTVHGSHQNMLIHWGRKRGSSLRKKRATTPLNISVKDNGVEAIVTVPKLNLRQLSKKLYNNTDMTWSAIYNHKLPKPFRRLELILPAIVPAQQGRQQHCIVMVIETDGRVKLQAYPSKTNADTKSMYCDTEAAPTDPIDCDEDIIMPQDFVFSYIKAK